MKISQEQIIKYLINKYKTNKDYIKRSDIAKHFKRDPNIYRQLAKLHYYGFLDRRILSYFPEVWAYRIKKKYAIIPAPFSYIPQTTPKTYNRE